MTTNSNNKKKSNSELIYLNSSKLSTLQYIKVIYIDAKKELHEIQTETRLINKDTMQLSVTVSETINITCPTGIALKIVTLDAIYFAKAILNEIIKNSNKYMFIIKTPQKAIRQQNRKYYRININCHCALLFDKGKCNNQAFIAQTVNISKGGVLVYKIESLTNDEQVKLPLVKNDSCYISLFVKPDLRIKTYAEFVRTDFVDNTYRYAFQFINISKNDTAAFDKYLTAEEFKLLNIKNKSH